MKIGKETIVQGENGKTEILKAVGVLSWFILYLEFLAHSEKSINIELIQWRVDSRFIRNMLLR